MNLTFGLIIYSSDHLYWQIMFWVNDLDLLYNHSVFCKIRKTIEASFLRIEFLFCWNLPRFLSASWRIISLFFLIQKNFCQQVFAQIVYSLVRVDSFSEYYKSFSSILFSYLYNKFFPNFRSILKFFKKSTKIRRSLITKKRYL